MNIRDKEDHSLRNSSPRAATPDDVRSKSRVADADFPSDTRLTHLGLNHLGLTELSPTEWRVVDALRPQNDASRVLGFIQRVGAAYEVTSLIRLRERTYFSSFDRAAASLDPRPVLA